MLAPAAAIPHLSVLGLTGPVLGGIAAVAGVALVCLVWRRRRSTGAALADCRTEIAALFAGRRDMEAITAQVRVRLAAWKAEPATAALIAPALAEVAQQLRHAHAYESYGLAHVSAQARTHAYGVQLEELHRIFGVCVEFGGWADASTLDLLQRLTRLQGDLGEHEAQVRILERTCAEGLPHLPADVVTQVRRELDYAIVLRNAKLKASARASHAA